MQPCRGKERDAIKRCLMTSETLSENHRPTQTVRQRVFWFLVGAVLNYLLIATPLAYLKKHTDLPMEARVALSVGVSTTFFFIWNYFVNFRTASRKRDAFVRYVSAVIVLYALQTSILTSFK